MIAGIVKIAGLLLVAILVLGILICALVVIYKVRRASATLFGTENLSEAISDVKRQVATTPKSVSSMTSLMEPQIVRDFPDFVWEQFRDKANNLLIASLTAISNGDISLLDENVSEDVRTYISSRIEGNRIEGITERFNSIKIHQTEIANYKKNNGKCIITIQASVQYFHFKEKAGRVISGDRDLLTQTKYNMELMYIQNAEAAGSGTGVGLTCPSCGAPITNLGAKYCEFCGTGVKEINIKVWSLHNLYEVDYNHV